MKTNTQIAIALMSGPCIELDPDGAVDLTRDGKVKLPPRVTDKVLTQRAKIHAAGRAKMAAKRRAVKA